MVEVMKIMATSFKRFDACTALPPTLKQATADPEAGCYLPTPPLEIPGHSWA